jgi:hypothetical protein
MGEMYPQYEHQGDEAIIKVIDPMVETFRKQPHLELEVRLGIIHQNKFEAGVSYDYSSALYRDMTDPSSLGLWDLSPSISNFQYKYYQSKPPGKALIRARYSVSEEPEYNQVSRLCVADIACSNRTYDLRVALKEEIPLKDWTTSEAATLVRVNTRCSIQHRKVWRYDFSKTGQGKTTEEACNGYTVMVEMELIRDDAYLNTHSNREIAINLLGKGRDMLGRYSTSGVRELLPLVYSSKH